MKLKLLQTIVALFAIIGSATAQTLSVQDIEVQTGERTELVVSISGATNMTALQFNLQLPSGLTAYVSSTTLGAATNGHTLYLQTLNSGDRLFSIYSTNLNTFSDGELLRIPIKAGNEGMTATGSLYTVRTATTGAVSQTCANATFTVTVIGQQPDDVTLTARSYTREYGEENPAFGYDVTSGTITSGTPTITCSATKTSPVGTYDIIISKGTVSNSTVNLVKGTLTITKAPLTISAGNYTKQEGEANPTFTPTFSGFKNGETKSVLTKQPTISCTATTSSPAGTYPVTVSGAEAQNYSISYVNGTLTVTEKPIITDDEMTVAPVKAVAGRTAEIVVSLSNPTTTILTGFQMRLFLPEGITMQKRSGNYVVNPSSRVRTDAERSVSETNDGAYLITFNGSSSSPVVSDTEGELIRIPVNVGQVLGGAYQGIMNGIEIRNVNNRIIRLADVTFDITVQDVTTGVSDAGQLKENEKAGEVYDLSGRRMKKPVKGLNIIQTSDGQVKKVVIK